MAKKAIKKSQKKKNKKQEKNNVSSKVPRSTIGVTPLADRVVVRVLTEDEMGTKSPAGIIIPDTVSKEKPEQGIVVAIGLGKFDEDGVRRIPMTVEIGDRIVFSKYGYDEIKVGGKEYIIVSESSVLAIIKQ